MSALGQKQTCAVHSVMSALCQKRTHAVQQTALTNTSSANTSSVAGAHSEAAMAPALRHSILTVSAIPGKLLRYLSARPSPAPVCATGP